ncbi:MAG TPA: tyrosine-type recombinase/integrase [Saprospiraceae bacterium]|nr:tyrosine-type recombinase/integrase [Saprospiraceae bacterium]
MHIKGFFNYLEYEKRVSPDTIRAYRKDLDQFQAYLEQTYDLSEDMSLVKAQYIRSWVVDMVSKGFAMSTVKRKLSALKSYFNYLQRHHELAHNPMVKIPIPKTGRKLPIYLKESSIDQVFDRLAWTSDFSSQRDRLILELLYNTGLRRAELIDLKQQRIDWSRNYIKVLGKGAKERLIPFGKTLEKRIRDYLDCRRATFPEVALDHLLLTDQGKVMYPKFVYNKVKKYLSMVSSVEKLSPHVLRHTFATHLANRGADLHAIKELLGHSSLAATQVYTHNTIDQLKAIYEQAHPKAKSGTT